MLSTPETRDFTLPSVAKALGVSHAALYRHFDGKAGLLAALAMDGYQRFGVALKQAIDGQRGQGLLRAAAVTCCAFARGEPALFRAMFTRCCAARVSSPMLEAQAALSFQSLGAIVQDLKGAWAIEARLTGARSSGRVYTALTRSNRTRGCPVARDYARAISRKPLPEALAKMCCSPGSRLTTNVALAT